MHHQESKKRSRRDVLRTMGLVAAAVPLASVLSCGDDAADDADDAADDTGDASTAADASAAANTSASGDAATSSGWATGGTAAMTALASYPNPFNTVVDMTCTPTCQLTLGPCHDDQAPEREDVSEGKSGLPMRFALRILDEDCKPVGDADVDIWHCDALGVYSSETADNPGFCTGDNAEALKARFFRGHRQTDESGVVWFNTCFPGWYSSRAIHVHFTVRRTSRQGDEYLTSQVAFPPSLITELCGKHPDYASHGQPDTPNTSDTVFPSADVDNYVMDTQQMTDGALLAYKTIIIRSSLSNSVCSPSGAAGAGGPAGGMGAPPGRPDGGLMPPPGA
ncbi:MAG: hypothetical protein RL385_6008 [Pseudomonadota bacterium]